MSDTQTSQKWVNIDAGPRQCKDLQKAMGALQWEGKTFDELTGVVGGDEHRSTMTSPFSACRAEVTALDEAIRVKYGHQVTKATVRAIIADYEAAVPAARESRPVQDSRRTPEEDAERNAATAAREAQYQAGRDARNAVLNAVMAKAPRGAKALIIAEYNVDASDPMTDYFASHSTRTAAIGWRFSSREDFRALAAAARQFPETASVEFTEHRDNYSMGAGNYLSDHGWAGSGTGWLIKSRTLPCSYVNLTEDALPEQCGEHGGRSLAACDHASKVTVSPSSLGKAGVVEIRFDDKPDPDVIASLKAHGFRWARGNRCWYGSDTAYADSLAGS